MKLNRAPLHYRPPSVAVCPRSAALREWCSRERDVSLCQAWLKLVGLSAQCIERVALVCNLPEVYMQERADEYPCFQPSSCNLGHFRIVENLLADIENLFVDGVPIDL